MLQPDAGQLDEKEQRRRTTGVKRLQGLLSARKDGKENVPITLLPLVAMATRERIRKSKRERERV